MNGGVRAVYGAPPMPGRGRDVPPRPVFRAGDHVHHKPSGEDWVLAADQDRDEVVCCGWPESIAKASDCDLKEAASDEYRLKVLTDVADGCAGQHRGRLAKHQLEAPQRAAAYAARVTSENQFIVALRARLNQGAKDYGEKSFSRSLPELLGEIEQELLDQAGWAYVGWCKIQRMKAALTEADRLAAEAGKP